ncbi:MAG: hypothetical protein H7A43_07850 [Verrucomicrobia bacterium]|nr:hypothetical protein [Verrucomicrobiota bacterium]
MNMRRFLVLSFCALWILPGALASEYAIGTQRVNLSGMFDPNTEGGSRFQLGFGYGQFVIDTVELGGMFAIQADDVIETFSAGLYLEKNLYGGGPLIPFVGSSFQFISSNIDVQNLGVEKSASGFGLGLYGGASIFVHPDIALRAQVTFSAATDDVYAEEEDIANTDIRLDIGLSFYF